MVYFNEYLNFRFGAQFEEKYDRLAVEEIKNNYDEYKDYIRLDKDQLDEILETDNDEGYGFDGDEQYGPSVEEGLMLLRAYIKAFVKENRDKLPTLKSVEFGKGYLEDKHTYMIENAYYRYNGYKYLYVSSRDVVISELFFRPINDYTKVTESRSIKFHNDNKEILKNIAKSALETELQHCFNEAIFNNEGLVDDSINGKKSYTYFQYIYDFGKNIIPIYTTDLGFDPFCLTRDEMLKAVIDEYQSNDILRSIKQH